MKHWVAIGAVVAAATAGITAQAQQGGTTAGAAAKAVWMASGGLEAPESAYFDADSNTIFVSLMIGTPQARDGKGGIAKLSPDGKVVSTDWVTGLNAPKGLRAFKGTLWTADLDEIIGVEIASGKITARVKVPDAKLLNDVAVGPDGTVYVTDTAANRVIACGADAKPFVFFEGADLAAPNGLLIDGDRLIIGNMGSGGAPGRLIAVDLKTKAVTPIGSGPIGAIDGIESDGRGGFILTDVRASKVLHVTKDGAVHELLQVSGGAADLAVLTSRGLAVVPHLQGNNVGAYDISSVLK